MACNYQGLSKVFLSAASVVAMFVLFGAVLNGAGAAVEAAGACNSTNCALPDCQCASMDIPGGLTRDQVPQMVTISFDDSLRLIDYNSFFSEILKDRKNPNGQNVSFTFFVSHEYTDYSLASKLAGMGHELAVHSVTHRTPNTFWSSGENDATIEREIVDMKNLLVRWADVPEDRVVGWRTPFLASSEDQLKILHENDFLYDCTMVTNDMYWPFTLDYKSPICDSPAVCPDQALPGLWVVPNVNKVQNSSYSCSMIDGCAHPTKSTYDQWMYFFKHNFERHYNNNKVPFGLYAHASWFYFPNMADRLRAFIDFMGYLGTLDDVYIVSMSQLVAWSKNPTPLSEISSFQPWQFHPAQSAVCSETNGKTCSYNRIDGETQYFHICGDDVCPESYPTLYNPEGKINVESSSTYEIQSMSVTSSSLDITGATSYNNYELFQTTVSSSPQGQSSGHFANAHITSTVPISSNVISSLSASQSALPSILNTMTTEGIRLPASSDSTMPIASASELARIIVSSMASNSAGQPEMMTTMSQVEFLTESSSAVGTSTTGENSMQTVLLLSEIRTLLAETVAITTSSSITVSDSVSDSTVDSLEDSTSGAVAASEQTSDAALSMAITTSSSNTVSDSVSDSTVDSLEDSTSGAVVASEQTSDAALSMAITTSSSITVSDSVSDYTVDSLEDSTSGAVVASEQTSGALSMAITTSSSITVSDSVLDSTVDSLDNTTSGAAVTSEQTSGALSMAITTSSSNTVSDSVLESTVDYLEDFTSGAVVASEQTSGALSMAITTSSSITVSDSVSDSTVDSLEDTTSGAVVASEQTSDVPASSSVIMRTHYPSSSSMGTFTADQGNMQTVTLPGESSALRAETMAIATASSITVTSVADSVSDSASDSLEETTSIAVEVSKQTSDVLSGADMGTQYLSSGTSESAHSSPPVSSSTSVSTTSPAGDELQDELNPGLTPGVAAAIAIAVVVTVVAAVAVTAGLGAVAVKSGGLASTASTATIMSNPLSSSVPV